MEHTQVFDRLYKILRLLRRTNGGGRQRGHSTDKLLQILLKQDGITAGEMAEILDIRPSSLTEQLGRLEHHGLVERKRGEVDSRTVHIYITPKGKEEIVERIAQRNTKQSALIDCFTPEEEATFIALSDKLILHLQEHVEKNMDRHHHHHHHKGHGRREQISKEVER